MHAKMTRDRKKNLLNELEHAVDVLQQEIAKLKSSSLLLAAKQPPPQQAKPSAVGATAHITPVTSPELTSMVAQPPLDQHREDAVSPELPPTEQSTQDNKFQVGIIEDDKVEEKTKRSIQHGFVLSER
jgi:hypothetical protein